MTHYYHTLHRCGHAAFWNSPDVAADMFLKHDCPWCGGDTKKRVPPAPSIIRFNNGCQAVAVEGVGADDEMGTVALYHHRADERCCAIGIATTIIARKAREDMPG